MKTLVELKEVFNVPAEDTTTKFFSIVVIGNPYEVVSNHTSTDVSVCKCEGDVYACTVGTIDNSIATEITV